MHVCVSIAKCSLRLYRSIRSVNFMNVKQGIRNTNTGVTVSENASVNARRCADTWCQIARHFK